MAVGLGLGAGDLQPLVGNLVVEEVVGLVVGAGESLLLPAFEAGGVEVGYPVEVVTLLGAVVDDVSDERTLGRGLLGHPVESGQFDMPELGLLEAAQHLVDIPAAGQCAVGFVRKVQYAVVDDAPVGRAALLGDRLLVDDRVGDRDDDLPFRGRNAERLRRLLDGTFDGVDHLAFGEVVVDQFEPIGLRGGREDRTVFVLVSRVEGHFGAAGADIADFEQQEPVEEPVRLAVAVGVGDVVFHAVDAPVAVAGASGIDQHHVRGRAGFGFAGGLCRGRQHAGQCRQ